MRNRDARWGGSDKQMVRWQGLHQQTGSDLAWVREDLRWQITFGWIPRCHGRYYTLMEGYASRRHNAGFCTITNSTACLNKNMSKTHMSSSIVWVHSCPSNNQIQQPTSNPVSRTGKPQSEQAHQAWPYLPHSLPRGAVLVVRDNCSSPV